MKQAALGMIETLGLVASIEAADAGVKAADVKLLGCEKVKGGLVMVAFAGEVAAVQAGVSAGCVAAEKVGTVISCHVIPRPEADLRMLLQGKHPEPDQDPPGSDPAGKGLIGSTGSTDEAGQELTPDPVEPQSEHVETERGSEIVSGGNEEPGDLQAMTVVELRKLARKTPAMLIQGREISRANKEQLIQEITRARAGYNKDSTPEKS
jgi:ethanolamine utilization protein EutM